MATHPLLSIPDQNVKIAMLLDPKMGGADRFRKVGSKANFIQFSWGNSASKKALNIWVARMNTEVRMTKSGDITAKRLLPFSIEPKTWDGLSADIQRLLWAGFCLKLQLDEMSHGRQQAGPVDEARRAGLIKPVAPLTPEQSVKRQQWEDARAARLQAVKQAAADKISRLQRQAADEDKFGRSR